MSVAIDISPPILHNTFSVPVAVDKLTEKTAQVIGTAGGHVVEIHGSDDGVNYQILTGSGVSGAEALPVTGHIALDDWYLIPQTVAFLKTRKTDNNDVAQVTILLQARRAAGT